MEQNERARAEEDRELADFVGWYRKLYPQGVLDADEQMKLAIAAKAGDVDARNRLIATNLAFVVSRAKRYRGRGLPILDLVQHAIIGMVRAAERFEPEKGFVFLTYAGWWIKQKIVRAIQDHARLIRVPVHLHDAMKDYLTLKTEMTEKLGRPPSRQMLQAAWTGGKVKYLEDAIKVMQPLASVEVRMKDDDETRLREDTRSPDPTDEAESRQDASRVLQWLDKLPERDRLVVELRNGLNGKPPTKWREMALIMGVTHERCRQIHIRALRKLKHIAEGTDVGPPERVCDCGCGTRFKPKTKLGRYLNLEHREKARAQAARDKRIESGLKVRGSRKWKLEGEPPPKPVAVPQTPPPLTEEQKRLKRRERIRRMNEKRRGRA